MLQYGDIFDALSQTLGVNVSASPPNDGKWAPVSNVLVKPGEKWYYASLAADIDDAYEEKDDDEGRPVYLIHDTVGTDGWGAITVYKDIKWVRRTQPILPTFVKQVW